MLISNKAYGSDSVNGVNTCELMGTFLIQRNHPVSQFFQVSVYLFLSTCVCQSITNVHIAIENTHFTKVLPNKWKYLLSVLQVLEYVGHESENIILHDMPLPSAGHRTQLAEGRHSIWPNLGRDIFYLKFRLFLNTRASSSPRKCLPLPIYYQHYRQ